MAGTIPVAGDLTTEGLAATLTSEEQLGFEQLTGIQVDSGKARNLATFIDQPNQLGPVAICVCGAACQGTKILSTTAYISGAPTKIDVYRLQLGS